MDKDFMVVKVSGLVPSVCCVKGGEIFLTRSVASRLQKELQEFFPRDRYKVFKEVKDAKKRVSTNKEL
jgi:hypothetical protein